MGNINQRAEGKNIIQVSGNVNTGPMPVDVKNLIPCPSCKCLVSPIAYQCVACGFPVDEHFKKISYRKKERKNIIVTGIVTSSTVISCSVLLYFLLPDEIYGKIYLVGGMISFAFIVPIIRYLSFIKNT